MNVEELHSLAKMFSLSYTEIINIAMLIAAIPLIPVGIPLIVDLTTDPDHDLVVDRNQL